MSTKSISKNRFRAKKDTIGSVLFTNG